MGCYNSIVINKPADEVWNALKHFHDMSWASNVITKLDKVGETTGNVVGAKRVLNDAFQETLLAFDGAYLPYLKL